MATTTSDSVLGTDSTEKVGMQKFALKPAVATKLKGMIKKKKPKKAPSTSSDGMGSY